VQGGVDRQNMASSGSKCKEKQVRDRMEVKQEIKEEGELPKQEIKEEGELTKEELDALLDKLVKLEKQDCDETRDADNKRVKQEMDDEGNEQEVDKKRNEGNEQEVDNKRQDMDDEHDEQELDFRPHDDMQSDSDLDRAEMVWYAKADDSQPPTAYTTTQLRNLAKRKADAIAVAKAELQKMSLGYTKTIIKQNNL
jgi:hypothetical protein